MSVWSGLVWFGLVWSGLIAAEMRCWTDAGHGKGHWSNCERETQTKTGISRRQTLTGLSQSSSLTVLFLLFSFVFLSLTSPELVVKPERIRTAILPGGE